MRDQERAIHFFLLLILVPRAFSLPYPREKALGTRMLIASPFEHAQQTNPIP